MTCHTDIDYESFPIADLDLKPHFGPSPPPRKTSGPVFTHIVHQCLTKFPETHRAVRVAIGQLREEHRGWRNPFPPTSRNALSTQNEKIKRRFEPGDLVQYNHFALGETRA